jgi:hypothetical protein
MELQFYRPELKITCGCHDSSSLRPLTYLQRSTAFKWPSAKQKVLLAKKSSLTEMSYANEELFFLRSDSKQLH